MVDPAQGTDNGINFNFIPESEAEAWIFITGLVPYIRDTFGESHLCPFPENAVDHHADSVYDQASNLIHSNTIVWINSSLALDDAFNYTDIPNESAIFQMHQEKQDHMQRQQDTPRIYRESDSISSFHSRIYMTTAATMATTAMEEISSFASLKPPNGGEPIPQPSQVSIRIVNISRGREISGLLDYDPRISSLQQQF